MAFDDLFKIHILIIIFVLDIYLAGSNGECLTKIWSH